MVQQRVRQQGEAIEQARKGPRPYVWAIVAISALILIAVFVARPTDDAADNVTAGMSQVDSARDPSSTARTPAVPDN